MHGKRRCITEFFDNTVKSTGSLISMVGGDRSEYIREELLLTLRVLRISRAQAQIGRDRQSYEETIDTRGRLLQ